MAEQTHRLGSPGYYDTPVWVVTVLGMSLGAIGLIHMVFYPEPLPVWVLEGVFVIASAAIIVYGGYWIASHALDRTDRWIAAGWTVGGAAIAVAFSVGFILSEELSGGVITESGQLVIFAALGGSVVALLVVISTQRRYHGPAATYFNEDWVNANGLESTGTEVTVSKGNLETLLSFIEELPLVKSLEDTNPVKKSIYALKQQCYDDVCEICPIPAKGTHRLASGTVICEPHTRALQDDDEDWFWRVEPIECDE